MITKSDWKNAYAFLRDTDIKEEMIFKLLGDVESPNYYICRSIELLREANLQENLSIQKIDQVVKLLLIMKSHSYKNLRLSEGKKEK